MPEGGVGQEIFVDFLCGVKYILERSVLTAEQMTVYEKCGLVWSEN